MNEVKTPKKPLIFYYVMVFLLLMLLNFMAIPWMAERQVREVDYGTFMTMTEDKKIAKVEIDESEIVFTDKDGNDRMQEEIQANYDRIRQEVRQIVEDEITRIKNDPELCHLIKEEE